MTGPNPPEDAFTNTVEDAAAYEMWRSRGEEDNSEESDYDESEEDNEDEPDDYCGCSDPGCPCTGSKRGIP